MKNKKSLYLLIPLTLIIWGILLWKIVTYTSSKEPYNFQYNKQVQTDSSDSISYKLIAKYPDPFLRNDSKSGETNNKQTSVKGISEFHVRNLNSLVFIPEINYKGFIENNNRKIALITFKNSKYILNEGDSIDQLIIQSIFPDSLIISYLDKTYTYEQK